MSRRSFRQNFRGVDRSPSFLVFSCLGALCVSVVKFPLWPQQLSAYAAMNQSHPMAVIFASCLPSTLREKQANPCNEFQRDSTYKNGQAPFFGKSKANKRNGR
jgi:hypothetical protein